MTMRPSPRPSSPVLVQAGTPKRASLVGCLGLVEPGLGLLVQRQHLPVLPGPCLARWCVQAELCLVRSPWSSWPECRLPLTVGGALWSCHPTPPPTAPLLPVCPVAAASSCFSHQDQNKGDRFN